MAYTPRPKATLTGNLRADVKYINRNLVKTLDKRMVLSLLRSKRNSIKDQGQADLLRSLINELDAGDYDG